MTPAPPYRRRVVDDELDEFLEPASGVTVAIAIEGARAVGKTSTAGERAATRYEFDDAMRLAVLRNTVPTSRSNWRTPASRV